VSQPTVRRWLARYVEDGLAGLRSEPRPGRPRTLDDRRVADFLSKALQTRPAKQVHWSVRSFAAESAISKDMAHRQFREAVRRSSFASVRELKRQAEPFVQSFDAAFLCFSGSPPPNQKV
jgi:transposase